MVTRGDEVLILHRAAHPPDFDGEWAWTNPTGAREPGETIEECARRELREETGLELDLVPVDTSGEWAIFHAEAPADAEVVLDAEHDRYEWVTLDEACRRCLPAVVGAGIRRGARPR